jgi:hypothetical protein
MDRPGVDRRAIASGVHAVALSSIGATVRPGRGRSRDARPGRAPEAPTRTSVLPWWPGFFFENFLHSLDLIRQGINGGAAGRRLRR